MTDDQLDALLAEETTDLAAQERLAVHENTVVRACLAANPRAGESVQGLLARDTEPEVREALAMNPNVTLEAQRILVTDWDYSVVEKLAANRSIDPEIQGELSYSDGTIFDLLATNPSLTLSLQMTFAKSDERVRAVTKNEGLKEDVARIIWKNHQASLHNDGILHLVQNSTVPQDILKEAVSSPHVSIREAAARNAKLPEGLQILLLADKVDHVRASLAYNQQITGRVLDALSQDESVHVRQSVAARLGVSATIQERLSFDKEASVTFALLRNRATKCTDQFAARFVKMADPMLYHSVVKDIEAADGLLGSWDGSLAGLAEAVELTRR